jgi:NAD-dependent SIR2 family protein deacetylase
VPHAGYAVLRRWAERWPTRVFTSNVDGAFQAAGFAPETVVECHGAIGMLQCTRPCHDGTWSADGSASEATGRRDRVDVAIDEDTMRARPPLPACPRCGAVARPNILMFGDGFWVPGHHAERMAAHRRWLRAQDAQGLVVVELGAGTAVPTVRRHAELASAASGALIRINVREPGIRHGRGVSLAAGARATLEAIDAALAA